MTARETTAAQATSMLRCDPNLVSALVECFDELQNLCCVARGLDLAFAGADLAEADDRLAVASLIDVVRSKVELIFERVQTANEADLSAAIREASLG